MSSINFDNPWLLFIGIPLIALFLVGFFLAVRKNNRNWHNVTSCILHLFIALCVAFSVAGTTVETVVTKTRLYVLADVSYSAHKNLDEIDGYIARLEDNLPPNTQLGVVCFGKDCEVLTIAGEKVRSVKEANVDDSGTNIVQAMKYVKNIYGNDVKKRLVLITDGKQSDESDTGALRSAVNELNSADIQVDAIFLDDNLKAGAKEAQLTAVEYSKTAYKNRNATATAVVSSKFETLAEVYLYRDGIQLAWEYVNLRVGRNYVDFTLPTDTEGSFDYEIRLSAEGDENEHNNVGTFTQRVSPVVKALLISDKPSDYTAMQEAFGTDASLTACVNNANIPYTVAQLSEYDEIILSNVNLATKNNCDMFVDSLLSVVNKLGKSLVTVGNLYLSGSGEGSDTATELRPSLQKLASKLPVDFGNGARDSKLVTFVFDASDSMYNIGRLQRAQSSAKYITKGLSDEDRVAIVYFHGNKGVQLSVTKLDSAENRALVEEKIDAIAVKQGTMMSGGLQEAYTQISQLTGYEKQVIMMSDGMNSDQDFDDTVDAWAQMLANANIPLSVIDVGRGANDKDDEVWVEAAQRLKRVASLGNGKYLLAKTNADLENFVFPQITDDVKDAIVDDELSAVNCDRRFDGVLAGIDPDEISYLNGYVNTGLRASATTVLSTEYRMQNGRTERVPVYSYWKVGKGKISSFTSSFSEDTDGNWLEKWKATGENSLANSFLRNVLFENTPTEKITNPFTVTIEAQTGYCALTLAHVDTQSGAEVVATVLSPDGGETEHILSYQSGVYACTFATPDVGKYEVEISYSFKGEKYTDVLSYNVSFLPEYDNFALFDAGVLYNMLEGKGRVSEDGNLSIEQDENSVELRIVRLSVPLLIIAVTLYAVDIVIRKLKWEDIRSFFKKNGGRKS